MKVYSILIVIFISFPILGQDSLLVGKKYFEDQIYTGISYNMLYNKPEGMQQKGVSTGLALGFIKDISLNKKGSLAIGIGVGYAYNKYIQNLKINKIPPIYSIIEGGYLDNYAVTHSVEIPLEFRFRITSTPTEYKFWRIYIGAKLAYIFAEKSRFNSEEESYTLTQIPNLQKWQFGPQIALGYNSLNFYFYYNIPDLFNNINQDNLPDIAKLKKLNLGFQFYIF